jgi:peptidoglycan/LPS O-acetylase OafA/YrhL
METPLADRHVTSSPQVSGMPAPESPSFVQSPTGDPGPINRIFYPALDGVRALAFLMVFGQHYLRLSWGWTGVDIFFVLSGFLITGILFDTKDRQHRVWNFYIRRTLRIFPLYYAAFFLVLFTWPWFRWQIDWTWLIWPAYLGNFARFVHPYEADSALQLLADAQPLSHVLGGLRLYLGHFWSLCVEEQFYLVWPWIVFLVKDRRRLLWLCVACVVMTPLLRLVGGRLLPEFMLDGEVLYRVTFFRADALLLGGMIALILRGGHGEMLSKIGRVVFAVCCVTAIAWFVLHPDARTLQYDDYPEWKFTWGLSFIDIFAASLIVLALNPASWTGRIFSFAPLRWMGRISYGAYVFHDILRNLWQRLLDRPQDTPQASVVMLGLASTLPLAWLSFRFFESPFIRLKERWTK